MRKQIEQLRGPQSKKREKKSCAIFQWTPHSPNCHVLYMSPHLHSCVRLGSLNAPSLFLCGFISKDTSHQWEKWRGRTWWLSRMKNVASLWLFFKGAVTHFLFSIVSRLWWHFLTDVIVIKFQRGNSSVNTLQVRVDFDHWTFKQANNRWKAWNVFLSILCCFFFQNIYRSLIDMFYFMTTIDFNCIALGGKLQDF